MSWNWLFVSFSSKNFLIKLEVIKVSLVLITLRLSTAFYISNAIRCMHLKSSTSHSVLTQFDLINQPFMQSLTRFVFAAQICMQQNMNTPSISLHVPNRLHSRDSLEMQNYVWHSQDRLSWHSEVISQSRTKKSMWAEKS